MAPVNVLASLNAPSRKEPLQRAELAAHLYRELASLERVALATLVFGIEKNRQVSGGPSDTTLAEYASRLAAYLDMREHESNDWLLRELKRLKESEPHSRAEQRTDKRAR